jgi:hypothetical protein
MDDVPEQLDRAVVRCVAPAMAGAIGHDYETGEPVIIAYYAIAQYAGDEPRAYLFGVSAEHEVVSDYLEDSIADAKEVAAHSNMASPSAWRDRA